MTPEEKAKELVDKFMDVYPHRGMSKNAAIMCCDEIIFSTQPADKDHIKFWQENDFTGYRQFWQQVKQHLNDTKKS